MFEITLLFFEKKHTYHALQKRTPQQQKKQVEGLLLYCWRSSLQKSCAKSWESDALMNLGKFKHASSCRWFVRNPANSPVEVRKSIPLFTTVFITSQLFWDFWSINMNVNLKPARQPPVPHPTTSSQSESSKVFSSALHLQVVFFCTKRW